MVLDLFLFFFLQQAQDLWPFYLKLMEICELYHSTFWGITANALSADLCPFPCVSTPKSEPLWTLTTTHLMHRPEVCERDWSKGYYSTDEWIFKRCLFVWGWNWFAHAFHRSFLEEFHLHWEVLLQCFNYTTDNLHSPHMETSEKRSNRSVTFLKINLMPCATKFFKPDGRHGN